MNEVEKSFKKGLFFLDGDTIVSPEAKAALDAVGSIITAIDSVQNKEFKMFFVLYVHLDTMRKKTGQWGFVFIIILP